MKIVTIDASAAAAWILPKQGTASADAFLVQGGYDLLIAPGIFTWEVANLIARRADGPVERQTALELLNGLGVERERPRSDEAITTSIDVAVRRDLSLFDNDYVRLSLERGASLATRDGHMVKVACHLGIEVFDLRH